jgi:hypothetical protein
MASVECVAGNLKAGDLVEVKSAEEILTTLDQEGACESLPFMPEMLKFCGKRFRVFKRANKVCDTIDKTGLRRMRGTVLLEGARCDGSDHGGCQAGCMILWKEQWLKALSQDAGGDLISIRQSARGKSEDNTPQNIRAWLTRHARSRASDGSQEIYRCQITELKKATMALPWWDFRIYLEDVMSGNRRPGEVIAGLLITLFNWVQRIRGGDVYPYMEPGALKKTPVEPLNLQPGDKVRVKSLQQIQATLDSKYKNRGLYFDVGMARFCGYTFQVKARVHKIIHEKTGEMVHAPNDNPMIILDGVICNADYQKFCPRSEYVFWREIWLEKIS